jgi:general secretion pathway protein G
MSVDEDDNSHIVPQSARLTARLLLSLATAVLVFVSAYYCAWKMYYLRHGLEYQTTRSFLELLSTKVEEYRQSHGKLPDRLEDLEVVQNQEFPKNDAGQAMDYWHNPFQYEVQDDKYQLYSFGRDGKPGGEGLDADLYAGGRIPFPTLLQFATLPDAFGTFMLCLLTGLIAFPICFLQGMEKPGKKLPLLVLLGRNALTALFALFIAAFLAGFYWSGH